MTASGTNPGAYYGSYNFLGTGIYGNLQSTNIWFTITVDEDETTFGSSEDSDSVAVPPNCTYGWSKMGLSGTDHLLEIMVKGANSATDPSYLGIESFVGSSGEPSEPALPTGLPVSNVSIGTSSAPSPTSTVPNPSASGSTESGHQGLSATDTITIVTSIIGGIAGVIAIIGGVYQCRKWQQGRRKSK
ncbi:hypothetical protein B0H17DRAFT_1062462 [Mycena rosella]|uniref:Uncharacterized protein n=1 Tax=Mycena rosella TaxID=1033263 RepID=A0AAD7GK48_MYCRO|nr:hypothetical protein B0H17DRAFT_1062462 [Mycena rosella]